MITFFLAVVFGVYTFKVGDDYDINSLVEVGGLGVVAAVGSLIVMSPFLVSGGLVVFSPSLIVVPVLYLVGVLLWLVAAFLFPIVFILATSKMKEETGLKEFSRAMIFSIVGLLVPGFFALAIIQFGIGLSSPAKASRIATK
jgi:hypothetical protein